MNKRKEVLELLKKEELTATEISEKTGIKIEIIRVYLSQFVKEKKVIIVDPTKGWHKKYRAIGEPIELLKLLYNIMDTKMKPVKPLDENEKEVLIEIMELI